MSLKYVCQKMRILRKSDSYVDWNVWKDKDRREVVKEEVEKLGRPWVEEEKEEDKHARRMDNRKSEEEWSEKLNDNITMVEYERAMREVKEKSAPGRDKIEYKMIKELPGCFKEEMVKIFNGIWEEEKVPESWKEYAVIFIDKKGKQKVRPIAMASCWCKVMERIVNSRLNWWAEKKKILDVNQNGFRKSRGCLDNLIEFTVDIRKSFLDKKKVIAVFLDVSSAYDNVQRRILGDKLKNEECPIRIRRFVDKWMKARRIRFIINEDNYEDRTLDQGLPQGGVLSPLLYDIYYHAGSSRLPAV